MDPFFKQQSAKHKKRLTHLTRNKTGGWAGGPGPSPRCMGPRRACTWSPSGPGCWPLPPRWGPERGCPTGAWCSPIATCSSNGNSLTRCRKQSILSVINYLYNSLVFLFSSAVQEFCWHDIPSLSLSLPIIIQVFYWVGDKKRNENTHSLFVCEWKK